MKIALIGRPNVGKSTLFNKLIEERSALETPIPGTTRDLNRDFFNWNEIEIEVIDTPGLEKPMKRAAGIESQDEEKKLEEKIQLQAARALQEADVLLFLIDGKTGATHEDIALAKKLRREKTKKIFLVVNKLDKQKDHEEAEHLYRKLGLGTPYPVSAANGNGISELLDALTEGAPKKSAHARTTDTITVALIGKPNVGKSSIFNALVGEEEVVVSPIPHTTRDPNNTEITYAGQHFTIIDTAGLRKKARIYAAKQTEVFSVQKALHHIEEADVVLLVLDLADGMSVQDNKLARLIETNHRACIIIGNKWDTVEDKTPRSSGEIRKKLLHNFKSFDWAPLVFTRALDPTQGKIYGLEEKYVQKTNLKPGANPLHSLFTLVMRVYENFNAVLSEEELHATLMSALKKQPPPKKRKRGSRRAFIKGITQVASSPPSFEIKTTTKIELPRHYIGYLKKLFREKFNLFGTDIVFSVKRKE